MQDRIKKLRKELDVSQQKFADKLGVKRNTVGQWECGINAITDQTVTSICREYNVNEEWLRYGKGEMFNKLDPENELMQWAGKLLGSTDSFKKNFVRVLMSLDEKEWEFLERKAKELANYCDNEKKG